MILYKCSINNGDVTKDILLNKKSKVLEINSKTGLYPLYITISLFKHRCLNVDSKKLDEKLIQELWNQTVTSNIYVVCKTPMAKSITNRTLVGYKKIKTNIINIENIIDLFSDNINKFRDIIFNKETWGKEGDEQMKFDAIIGNPPYQENVGNENSNRALSKQLFPLFMINSIKINKCNKNVIYL